MSEMILSMVLVYLVEVGLCTVFDEDVVEVLGEGVLVDVAGAAPRGAAVLDGARLAAVGVGGVGVPEVFGVHGLSIPGRL